MKTIVIKPEGGLCNRFRFIFSFIRRLIDKNKLNKRKLIILWTLTDYCPGYIDCYFQKIKNVEFKRKYEIKPDISSYKIITNYSNINYLEKIPLFLNNDIFLKIKKIIMKKLKNNYISIHIRRTDLQKILENKNNRKNKIISDKEYIKFINKIIKKNIKKKIYLATDNLETQEKFQKLYKDRLIVYENISDTNNIRKTNIEHSLIDLFICGCSKKFKGSYYSSYSDFIDLIQNLCKKYKDPISKLQHFYNVNKN